MDLEPIDAELVEDDDYLPALIGDPDNHDSISLQVLEPGTIYLPISPDAMTVIRQALAWYHDKGPRSRSTKDILVTMRHMAMHDTAFTSCANCNSTGKIYTSRGMEFCYCPIGVRRRGESGEAPRRSPSRSGEQPALPDRRPAAY